jgi:hypothetical protein
MYKTTLLLGLILALGVANTSAVSKKLWSEEDYEKTLGQTKEEDALENAMAKGIDSWMSSGEGPWSTTSAESVWYSSFSIEWASSYTDTNEGVGSADLNGAQTGDLFYIETYISTYVYSYKHTWASSGAVTRPDGQVSSWTSRYTTYWTSTWTSSYTQQEIMSTFTSMWTSCTTGLGSYTSVFTTQVWDSGSVATGEHEYESQFSTTSLDSWESTWNDGWVSTLKLASSSSWSSTSSRFFTSEW